MASEKLREGKPRASENVSPGFGQCLYEKQEKGNVLRFWVTQGQKLCNCLLSPSGLTESSHSELTELHKRTDKCYQSDL